MALILNFPQERIDEILSLLDFNYQNSVVVPEFLENSNLYGINFFFKSLKNSVFVFNRNDIIVGDTPAETLYISGYFYNEGNIFVINDGVLRLDGADFNLDGNIFLLNKGKMLMDSSLLRFLQDYIYQYGITVVDSAELTLNNSTMSYNGYPSGFFVGEFARVVINSMNNYDWTTAMVNGKANVMLNNVGITGEWLFADDCFARFNKVDNCLTWYFFPESSVVDIKFPDGAYVNGFYIDSMLGNVQGIGYHVEIDSSTNCMWAAIPLKGSNVTIDSSLLRVTGLLLGGSDSLVISGLVNGLYYEDYTLPITDRNYHLTNTTVQTWNLYPFDTISLDLSSSIFGELCAYGNSYVYIHNAFCDGSGGHLESNDNAFLMTIQSGIFADIISKGRSVCIIGYCAQPYGNIWVTGSSIMLLLNSIFNLDPIPSDTSLVFVASITGPPTGEINDTVAIIGSAWIDRGPYLPIDFGYYQIFYQRWGDTVWIPVSDTCTVEVRRDTLCYWYTTGLEPGNYVLRLVLKDDVGDSVDCLKSIVLYETGISERSARYYSELKIIPNPFTNFIKVEHISREKISELVCSIYDVSGRAIVENVRGNPLIIRTETFASGVYFICIKEGSKNIIKKIIKIE